MVYTAILKIFKSQQIVRGLRYLQFFAKFGNPTEVILARKMIFDKTQDNAVAGFCARWLLSSFSILYFVGAYAQDPSRV